MKYISKCNNAELLEKRRLSLNAAIRDRGLRNGDVARETAYCECYVSQMRKGRMSVSENFLSVFCQVYGFDFRAMLSGEYTQVNTATNDEIVRDIAIITSLCRKQRKLTYQKVSEKIYGHDGSVNTIYRFERGLNEKIDLYTFEPIAEFYGLDKTIAYDDRLRKQTMEGMGICA